MIALLDVKYSNLKAYANLLTYLGVSFEVVECADKIKNYHDTLVLPGVSSFKSILTRFSYILSVIQKHGDVQW